MRFSPITLLTHTLPHHPLRAPPAFLSVEAPLYNFAGTGANDALEAWERIDDV